MKFFLKCDEAAHVCDKSQYKESSFFEKLKLQLHILLCSLCRSHVKRNCDLSKTIHSANLKSLSPKEKQMMKNRLDDDINARP